jgi:hypothetical protein
MDRIMNMDINIYLGFFFTGILLFALIIAVLAAPGPKRKSKHVKR